jgi:hypothetical protein
MNIREHFAAPRGYKNWMMGLMGVGAIALLLGIFVLAMSKDEVDQTRFWAGLMHNSIFFLLVVNASMFFICATTLAFGGWQTAFRRVPEAISSVVPILGVLNLVVLMSIVFGHRHDIYHWLDAKAVAADPLLNGKKGFLNPIFYSAFSIITIVLWSVLGRKMRALSLESDNNPMNVEEGKKFIYKNTVWAALYIVVFALSVASTLPWFWLMSIDAHWFSTMYSWYTFASSFVAGMALIALFVIYLKNQGYLEYVNEEHMHDIGKFMFAFSVFWTYLWFSQYMLIWYANISEETVYFKPRVQGVYKGIFFFNLIINFVAPLLLLMRRGAKRNYTTMTMMAVLILFGHWIDFYQMIMPGTMHDHAQMSWFEFGLPAGFVGIIMWGVSRYMAKNPMLAKNHPFLKESIIHHT